MNDQELLVVAAALERQTPESILTWAAKRFAPHLTFATGFGAEGCVLIDMIGRLHLPIDVFTLDTGLLFSQTYELWQRLQERYVLTIRPVRPTWDVEEQAQQCGPRLWERDPDRCCDLRKVQPLETELRRFKAWITAIRRDQTAERAGTSVVERDRRFGLVKINPLVAWSSLDVWKYISDNNVPYNPLHDQGFPSIGCQPCTSPVQPGEDPRAGRWRNSEKTECGLHVGVMQRQTEGEKPTRD